MDLKKFLFGGFLQTKDNNMSLENQLENEYLTEEFNQHIDYLNRYNTHKVLAKLQKYEEKKEYLTSGLLLTSKESKDRAVKFYVNLLNCSMIDDFGALKPAINEVVEDVING